MVPMPSPARHLRPAHRASLHTALSTAFLIALAGPLASAAQAQLRPASAPSPYVLGKTERLVIDDPVSHRAYEVMVALPPSWRPDGPKLPVVYVTDAPYAFPLLNAITGRFWRHEGQMGEFILVGLGYAVGEDGATSRNRDYTPFPPRPEPGRYQDGQPYGQADAYLAFLEKTALPAIERAYRADGQQRTYMGHSYGALLGAQALLKKPGLFRHAVLSSPSLWFGQSQMLKDFGAPSLPALPKGTQVLLYAGSFEVPAKGRTNPRYNREVDLAGDMQRLARLLRECAPQAQVEAKVFDDEDHLSVFPRMATHALMRLHPRRP